MNPLGKFIKEQLIEILIILVRLFSLFTSCGQTEFYEKDGIYCSQSPYIQLDCLYHSGTMTVVDISYPLDLAFDPAGSHILIYCQENADAEILDTIREDDTFGGALIWKAETKEKNGKLYLTVTKDNISDYVGKTIVLEFIPNE